MADNIVITAELKDLVSGHLKDITAQVNKLEGSLANVGRRSSSGGSMLGSVFGGNLLASGFSKLTTSAIDFTKATVDSLVNYEYFSSSLKAMLKGDGEMAKSLEGQLINLAKTTPFSLVDVQQGTKQLIAYGFSAGSVVENMKMLGDVSAGVGKPLGEVAYLYGTLKTQGRAFSKDINQFTSAGIPIIKELAKQFNVTDSNVMKLVESGKVGFAEVEKAFKSMTSEGSIFFNLMDVQSKTVGGKISALGDSWEQLKVNIGKSQTGIISATVSFFDGMISQYSRKVSAENFYDTATGTTRHGSSIGGMAWNDNELERIDQKKAFAAILEKKLQENTRNSKGLQETAQFISGEFQYLQRQKTKIDKKSLKSEDDKNELFDINERRKMLIYAKDQLLGAARLLNSNPLVKHDDNKTDGNKDVSSLEKVAKANRPTQINVNIENLVREINNTYQNVQKGMELTGEQIAKVLIGVVNDVSVTNFGN